MFKCLVLQARITQAEFAKFAEVAERSEPVFFHAGPLQPQPPQILQHPDVCKPRPVTCVSNKSSHTRSVNPTKHANPSAVTRSHFGRRIATTRNFPTGKSRVAVASRTSGGSVQPSGNPPSSGAGVWFELSRR